MKIRARVRNGDGSHEAVVETAGSSRHLDLPPKEGAAGSAVNGGELLFLALATCYCNDVYREAAKRDLRIDEVHVEVVGEFGAEGESARRVSYDVRVTSPEDAGEVEALLRHTDTVAEIQNTVRGAVPVELVRIGVGTGES